MSDELYYIWYSAEQDMRHRESVQYEKTPAYETFAKLEDGSIALYSEMKSDDSPSNFDDAVYLGRGNYSHCGARIN